MVRSLRALVSGGVLALVLAGPARSAELSLAPVPAGAAFERVQYGGPGFDGPYGEPGWNGGPMGGPDLGGPGMGGPGWGGPGEPGYGGRPRRGARASRSGPVERLSYHGFRMEFSAGDAAREAAAIEHQIDIVDSVGLSVSERSLFRGMSIRVVSGLGGGGSHYSGGSRVTMGGVASSDNRPVLLHEYMHVLNAKRLPGGFHNPDIRHFYQEAQAQGLYESGSYMMSNPAEFFAVTASCYLYGTVAREPYNRETIRQRQPDYYAYLEHLFGPARAGHVAADGGGALR